MQGQHQAVPVGLGGVALVQQIGHDDGGRGDLVARNGQSVSPAKLWAAHLPPRFALRSQMKQRAAVGISGMKALRQSLHFGSDASGGTLRGKSVGVSFDTFVPLRGGGIVWLAGPSRAFFFDLPQ